jgi:hypothetical protein
MTTGDEARSPFRARSAGGRRLPLGLFLIALALATAGVANGASAAGEVARPATRFADQITSYFDLWDDDGDGGLSFEETSRRVPDIAIHDETAAALAAVHLAQRFEQWKHATFSRSELLAAPDNAPGRLPPFEAYYDQAFAHIRATGRKLFVGEGPRLRSFHQGLLGDCYFVATLGALVERDPVDVTRLIRAGTDGSFDVRFPNGESSHVAKVSDTEIALGSYVLGQGLWLNVLEKAYGELVARSLQRRRVFENALDAVGSGGLATSALTLFTGSDPAVLRFRPDDSPMIASALRVEGFLPLARAQLSANVRLRRLTCCGTTNAETPPGLAKSHLYAVLDFDASKDVVHVWNPWGNHFDPQGPAGIAQGYRVRDGHFFVPLSDFIRIFASVIYESDRPESLD